ncbi:MAG: phosphotransacetylase family protein [Thermodesulfovibrionales bacterium]|nr:phosphotransacetylase family protein [Thermodesulfovibrionales bacterium]
MKKIFILSLQPFAGKTFLSIGLLDKLIEKGFSTGYIKPMGLTPQLIGESVYDADAVLIKELFKFKEPLDVMSPFVITYETIKYLLQGRLTDIKEKITNSIAHFSGKDIIIISGAGNLFTGTVLGIDSLSLVKETGAMVIAVENFSGDSTIDNLAGIKKLFEERFLGAVINRIPPNTISYVNENIKTFLEKRGIRLFGLFTKDEVLESITVRDLVSILNARVLCCEDRLDELVEHFTVGAMDVDNALRYFRRIPNKAVITGAHRADIQLAAMETSTKVIILTGGMTTNDVVIARAISKGIPLLSVEHDTFTTVDKIEFMLGKVRIKEPQKIERLREMFDRNFDIDGLLKELR